MDIDTIFRVCVAAILRQSGFNDILLIKTEHRCCGLIGVYDESVFVCYKIANGGKLKKMPAITEEATTPATFGPMACISSQLWGFSCCPTM